MDLKFLMLGALAPPIKTSRVAVPRACCVEGLGPRTLTIKGCYHTTANQLRYHARASSSATMQLRAHCFLIAPCLQAAVAGWAEAPTAKAQPAEA